MRIELFGTVPLPVTAVRITEENLQDASMWCKGQIMGIKLPMAEQIVEFHFRGEECRAEVGDWIVSYNADEFFPYTNEIFQQRFIPY